MTKPMTDERYKELRRIAKTPWAVYTVHTHQLQEALDEVDRLREENESQKCMLAEGPDVLMAANKILEDENARLFNKNAKLRKMVEAARRLWTEVDAGKWSSGDWVDMRDALRELDEEVTR